MLRNRLTAMLSRLAETTFRSRSDMSTWRLGVLHSSFFQHHKPARMARSLGIDKATIAGQWAYLYAYAAEYAPDGNLAALTDSEIESRCLWSGEAGKWIESAVSESMLDRNDDGTLSIHDYIDWRPDYVRKKAERRRARRTHVQTSDRKSPVKCPDICPTIAGQMSGQVTSKSRSDVRTSDRDLRPNVRTSDHESLVKCLPEQSRAEQSKSERSKTPANRGLKGTESTKLWDELYEAAHGAPYTWSKKDAIMAAGLLNTHGAEKFRELASRYFEDGREFVVGHPIGKLVNDINRYKVPQDRRNGTGSGRVSGNGTTPLLSDVEASDDLYAE